MASFDSWGRAALATCNLEYLRVVYMILLFEVMLCAMVGRILLIGKGKDGFKLCDHKQNNKEPQSRLGYRQEASRNGTKQYGMTRSG